MVKVLSVAQYESVKSALWIKKKNL
jgi:hypothetical protein